MDWLIAYDITDPKRLRRVARQLEKHAARSQYSVFLYSGTDAQVERLLNEVETLLRGEDVVQAWAISGTAETGLVRGKARPIKPACVVMADRQVLIVDNIQSLKKSAKKDNTP